MEESPPFSKALLTNLAPFANAEISEDMLEERKETMDQSSCLALRYEASGEGLQSLVDMCKHHLEHD